MTINNVRDFIQGYFNYFRNYLDDESLETHVKEQALYRAMQCVGCLNNGKCTECGCATPAMFFSPNKEDSMSRWGKMISKEDWEVFKKENNIELINNFEELMYEEIRKRHNFRVLKPEWFVYRGQNCFDKMNPAFLMTIDELFDRLDYKPLVVTSYDPETHNSSCTVRIYVMDEANERVYQIVKETMELGLSLDVSHPMILIEMNPLPYFKFF